MPIKGFTNRVRTILRERSTPGLVRSLRRSGSQAALGEAIQRKFPDIGASETAVLTTFADRAMAAGEALNNMSTDSALPLSSIPTNVELFGDEPGGDRINTGIIIEWENDAQGTSGEFLIQITGAESMSPEEIAEHAMQQALEIITNYEDRIPGADPQDIELTPGEIIFVERKF